MQMRHLISSICLTAFIANAAIGQTTTKTKTPKPEYPPHATVLAGYEKVASSSKTSMYTLWKKPKTGDMLAELPRSFASKKYFFAMTVGAGDTYAGLQVNGDRYVYWRKFGKRLALIEPNLAYRAEGEAEAKASVKRLFTDQIVLDMNILTMGPGGGPVIDLDEMLVQKASTFFGPQFRPHGMYSRVGVHSIKTAKAFEKNIEVAYEAPDSSGKMKVVHYSISEIPTSTGYKPRVADERIGYFTTAYSDLSKYDSEKTRVRYITRWHLEKDDASLKMSPPKKPILFIIEHTTPVRYRRWVKQGILSWNKAFEKVGIDGAIQVEYQNAKTGAHMDKDPEDVNYNFVRWLNNDIGTAIGPSRIHPLTGQILDADIILTDGWIRHYEDQFTTLLPKLAMQSYGPQTLAWLAKNPKWDPRVRLAAPAQRSFLRDRIARSANMPYGNHAVTQVDSTMMGDDEYDGLFGTTSQVNGRCAAPDGLSMDLAMMRMSMLMLEEKEKKNDDKKDGDKKGEDKKKKADKPKEQMLDGMPESFVGPLVAHLVAHEVGHTLGLRHNFKGSSLYTCSEVNSDEIKGKKQLAGSVMDYMGVNINMGSGKVQGDWSMTGIGPYDEWAIEYGYTSSSDLKPILARVAEPQLAFATDEDTWGPDPLARRYDFGKDPLDYAKSQVRLAKHHRTRILTDLVEDGESWSKARKGYEMTLGLQMRAVSMMGNWVGGAHVNRHYKGDKDAKAPIEVVEAEKQRKAMQFVIDNSFTDEAYGLTPELLRHMTMEHWSDTLDFSDQPNWPIHDRIMGLQASALTMLMNPTTLEQVYDNEFRVEEDKDMLTLPEVLTSVTGAIWTELDKKPNGKFTARKPMISSLRRNLQREHLERLIDLSMPGSGFNVAYKPIANLALAELRSIAAKIEKAGNGGDPYSAAHLTQAGEEIKKAIDAQYIYNAKEIGGGGGGGFFFGQPTEGRPMP